MRCQCHRLRIARSHAVISLGEGMKETRNMSQAGEGNPVAKKPYVKPRCVSEPIYETLALACGKLPGQSAVCHAAPRRS